MLLVTVQNSIPSFAAVREEEEQGQGGKGTFQQQKEADSHVFSAVVNQSSFI